MNEFASETTGSTSSSLLGRARSHDADAWLKVSQLYTPLVYRWARRAGLQDADAYDVVQDVFFRIANKLHLFRKRDPNDSFRGWLWTVTRNQIVDQFRKQADKPQAAGGSDAEQHLRQIPELSIDDSDAEEASFNTDVYLIHQALAIISRDFETRTWQAFLRSAIQGERTADIGEDLGMTKKAVRQAKYRVLQRLRSEFHELLDAQLLLERAV